MKYLLNNCTLLTKEKVNILIENDVISKISNEEINDEVDKIINLNKKLVLPGILDFKYNKNYNDKNELLFNEYKAYAKGGISSILEIEDYLSDEKITLNSIKEKNSIYSENMLNNYAFSNSTDLSFEFGNYERQGYCLSTRLFLTGIEINDDESIKEFFSKINEVIFKSNSIIISIKDENINLFFKYFKNKEANIGFINITTANELKRINKFKDNGYNFYSIINIDNFFFSSELFSNPIKKSKFKSFQDFPSNKDMVYFNKSLLNNEIDIVIANHEFNRIVDKFEFNKLGNPEAETFFPLIFELTLYLGLNLDTVNRILFLNLKKFLKLENRLEIKEGNFADLFIVDLDKFWFVSDSDIVSYASWTPYEGRRFWGIPLMTFINGNLVYDCLSKDMFKFEPKGLFITPTIKK